MLTGRWALAVAAAVTVVAVAAAPARAAEDCGFRSATGPDGAEVLVWTCAGDWSGPGGDGGRTCHTGMGGRLVRVPCVDPSLGWFVDAFGGCYITPADPQPAAGHPVWDGHDPGTGVVYSAACFATDGVDGMPYLRHPILVFLPSAQGVVGDLLERAVATLSLAGPDIHLAPDPAGAGLVGLPVWMWTPVTGSTWGPVRTSLTALGTTVTVVAAAERVSWDMGDGREVSCDGPGTPYRASYGAQASPTCGHVYEQPSRSHPGGRYQVTATTRWRLDWWVEGTAIGGTRRTTRESSATVRIEELRVVTS